MIIVEGMDNAGKSHLVKQLAKDLGLLVMNNQRRPHTDRDILEYLQFVDSVPERFPIILDRLALISEPIYGPICRNTHLLSAYQLQSMTLLLKSLEPIVIYCRPPDNTILAFGDEEQMDGVIKHGRALLAAYDLSMARLSGGGFNVTTYDWTTCSYKQLKEKLNEQL